MTTEAINRSRRGATTGDRDERAREAVRVFRTMQHGLSGYARAITGNPKARVEVSSGPPRTDGNIIYYRPPIKLGDKTKHDRLLCDKRDSETGILQCVACALREEVLVNIYHEIAHIAFGTFAPTTESAKQEVLKLAVEEWGDKYAEKVKARIKSAPPAYWVSYGGLAGLISPFLPHLLNCLEDARVDTSMFEARKGTRKMLTADTFALMREGVEDDNGNVHHYNEQPLNAQMPLACYMSAAGYDEAWKDFFHEKVVADIADEKLQYLLGIVRRARSALDVYQASFPILARLRELGYLLLPEEQEEQNDQSDEGDSGEQGSGSSENEQDLESDGDADGDSSGGDDSDSDSSVQGGPSSEDDSPPEDGDGEPSGSSGDGAPPESDGGSGDDSSDHQDGSGDGSELDSPDSGTDSESGESNDDSGVGDSEEGGEASSEGRDACDGFGQRSSGDSQGDQPSETEASPEAGEGDKEGDEADSDTGDSDSVQDDSGDSLGPIDSGADPIDSGADQGVGGIPVPEWGTADDTAKLVEHLHEGHGDQSAKFDPDNPVQMSPDESAVAVAVIQGLYFETPSLHVGQVNEWVNGNGAIWDQKRHFNMRDQIIQGIMFDCDVPEPILGPSLMKLRRIFTDNQISAQERHRRTGKVDSKMLGRRAWNGDDRVFTKKRLPGKKDYAVLISIDVSSSNRGVNLGLVKRAAFAQAELCNRLGIQFAVFAHSCGIGTAGGGGRAFVMDVWRIKDWEQPWDTQRKSLLSDIGCVGGNLDGHALEFGRRMLDRVEATDKILLYYTDGKMPAANKEEELEVLQREIRTCAQKRYTLLGVGIRTDSPVRHGLDTVQVDDDSDIPKVVEHLGRRLAGTAR